MRRVAAVALVTALLGGCAPPGNEQYGPYAGGQNTVIGTVAGAALGGFLGSRWTGAGSSTRTAATIGGALLGGAIGAGNGAAYDAARRARQPYYYAPPPPQPAWGYYVPPPVAVVPQCQTFYDAWGYLRQQCW